MAARLNKAHQDDVRTKIQTSQLVNRLQDFALGRKGVDLDPARIKAIEVLLRKSLPDLSAIDINAAVSGQVQIVISSADAGL